MYIPVRRARGFLCQCTYNKRGGAPLVRTIITFFFMVKVRGPPSSFTDNMYYNNNTADDNATRNLSTRATVIASDERHKHVVIIFASGFSLHIFSAKLPKNSAKRDIFRL